MKRSEMLEHIRSELRETMRGLSITNEKANKYFWRRSKELLDMIEGFGMLPPAYEREFDANIYGSRQTYELCKLDGETAVNEWEPEDES